MRGDLEIGDLEIGDLLSGDLLLGGDVGDRPICDISSFLVTSAGGVEDSKTRSIVATGSPLHSINMFCNIVTACWGNKRTNMGRGDLLLPPPPPPPRASSRPPGRPSSRPKGGTENV